MPHSPFRWAVFATIVWPLPSMMMPSSPLLSAVLRSISTPWPWGAVAAISMPAPPFEPAALRVRTMFSEAPSIAMPVPVVPLALFDSTRAPLESLSAMPPSLKRRSLRRSTAPFEAASVMPVAVVCPTTLSSSWAPFESPTLMPPSPAERVLRSSSVPCESSCTSMPPMLADRLLETRRLLREPSSEIPTSPEALTLFCSIRFSLEFSTQIPRPRLAVTVLSRTRVRCVPPSRAMPSPSPAVSVLVRTLASAAPESRMPARPFSCALISETTLRALGSMDTPASNSCTVPFLTVTSSKRLFRMPTPPPAASPSIMLPFRSIVMPAAPATRPSAGQSVSELVTSVLVVSTSPQLTVFGAGASPIRQVRLAGEPSVRPSPSRARTWKVCWPSDRFVYTLGGSQEPQPPLSRLQVYVTPGSFDEKRKVGPLPARRRHVRVAGVVHRAHLEDVVALGQVAVALRAGAGLPGAAVESALEAHVDQRVVGAAEGEGRGVDVAVVGRPLADRGLRREGLTRGRRGVAADRVALQQLLVAHGAVAAAVHDHAERGGLGGVDAPGHIVVGPVADHGVADLQDADAARAVAVGGVAVHERARAGRRLDLDHDAARVVRVGLVQPDDVVVRLVADPDAGAGVLDDLVLLDRVAALLVDLDAARVRAHEVAAQNGVVGLLERDALVAGLEHLVADQLVAVRLQEEDALRVGLDQVVLDAVVVRGQRHRNRLARVARHDVVAHDVVRRALHQHAGLARGGGAGVP